MKTTCIYELYAPYGQKAMYVGKGSKYRPQGHWKYFCRTGKAVSSRLRRWFEDLESKKLTPRWRIREIVPISRWEARERYWIAYWKKRNNLLCNVMPGGKFWSIPAYIRKEWCTNASAKAREIYPLEFWVKWGMGGAKAGTKALVAWRKANHDKVREHNVVAALCATHSRWHKARNRYSPKCKLCRQGKS